jgi:hypothetical protein
LKPNSRNQAPDTKEVNQSKVKLCVCVCVSLSLSLFLCLSLSLHMLNLQESKTQKKPNHSSLALWKLDTRKGVFRFSMIYY